MAINLTKLKRTLTRNKRVKGIEPDRRLERRLVQAAVRHGERIQESLLRDLMLTLEAVLPSRAPGTTVDVSMEVVFENAKKRFLELDDLKSQADKIFAAAERGQRQKFRALLQRTIGVDLAGADVSPEIRAAVEHRVDETINLIKTVNEEHFDEFRRLVRGYVSSGESIESFKAAIKKAGGKGYPSWKVERIAVDQFLTLHAEITKQRQTDVGITHYFWRTSGDARVRPEHQANEGERFAWADPPATGHPGDDIRCRCIADPDMSTVSVGGIESTKWGEISEERFAGIFKET